MPYLLTAQSWLETSTLLLSARPTTTRITTKYNVRRTPPKPSSSTATTTTQTNPTVPQSQSQSQHQRNPPKATLVLKTYDPVSGVCLKYRTDKAAEVGRLVASLGSCGRVMAALPERKTEEGGGGRGGLGEEVAGVGAGSRDEVAAVVVQPEKDKGDGKVKGAAGGAGGGAGGGGGKKRKGKR